MSLYHYLAIYIAGFIAMFALLVRGDRVHGLEFDLADTVITSILVALLRRCYYLY